MTDKILTTLICGAVVALAAILTTARIQAADDSICFGDGVCLGSYWQADDSEKRAVRGPSIFYAPVRATVTGTAQAVACAQESRFWVLKNGDAAETLAYRADGVTAVYASGTFLFARESEIGNNGKSPSYSIVSDGSSVAVSLQCAN